MKYLVTGIPGVGKTAAGEALQNLGHDYIDTDLEPGIAAWTNVSTGEKVPKSEHADAKWYSDHSWDWDLLALESLLKKYCGPEESVYVCGMTSNITEGFDLFDKVFLLQAPHDLVLKRMTERRDNPDQESIKSVFVWAKSYEDNALVNGAVSIDATEPISEVAQTILRLS